MPFKPRWPWGHRHVQSILPSIMPKWRLRRRAAPFLAASRELIVDCGEGVRLQAFHARPPGCNGLSAILLHGWEGSVDSHYMLSLGSSLFDAGVEVVRLNLRDHGDTHHLNEGIFHSCRLEEVCGAVAQLKLQLSMATPWLVGFSLGGNFMLRVAASGDPRVGKLAGVVAISPVLHPDNAMRAMEQGWQVYQRYFVHKWSRSLRRKHALWADLIDAGIFRLRELRGMTAAMVAQHTTFAGIGAYLDGYAITGDRLATLAAPAVILASRDDPIIPAEDLARLAPHPLLRIVTTERGGHMGFMVSPREDSWVNAFVARELGLGVRPAA
jgi:predicted alpha/beta-fold hydrolase